MEPHCCANSEHVEDRQAAHGPSSLERHQAPRKTIGSHVLRFVLMKQAKGATRIFFSASGLLKPARHSLNSFEPCLCCRKGTNNNTQTRVSKGTPENQALAAAVRCATRPGPGVLPPHISAHYLFSHVACPQVLFKLASLLSRAHPRFM